MSEIGREIMAWSETKEGLLKMMKANRDIFGGEILQINAAEEEWLINYFEKRLAMVLDGEIFGNSGYAEVRSNGWGLILKEDGFGLNIHQCIQIFYYIRGRVAKREYVAELQLHWTDSVVVINYIKDGYVLSESGYEFIRSTKRHINCHKYN